MNTPARSFRDPLRQELLPSEEIDEEIESISQERSSAVPVSPDESVVTPPSPTSRRPSWGVMGSILGRLTRSSSGSTSSSNGGEPCTLVSVDRLTQNCCPEYSAPIVGYEVMEERARFTIFKVRVQHQVSGRHWFVFRRYTDFARLNRKLRLEFPGLRFALPPKRWFGDNFDPIFLEDRVIGLQAFVNNIIAHMEVSKSSMVRNFFCFDDPPGPEDSLEESRMLCENLEDAVISLQEVVRQRDREVDLLKAEVTMLRAQQQSLLRSLKLQSRLSSVAYAQLQDEQQSKMDNGRSKQFLAQMQKVNHFNMTLAKTIDRSLKCNSLDLGSRLSLTRVEEENPMSASLEASSTSLLEKVVSMDDICSRSTGDGSTGSQERLPPVGGASEGSLQQEMPRTTTAAVHEVNSNSDSVKDIHLMESSRTNLPISDSLGDAEHCENSRVAIIPHDIMSESDCLKNMTAAQLQLDSISFKKLLENNPEIGENRLSKKLLLQQVVPLSNITIVSN